MKKSIEVECYNCHKKIVKTTSEYNRSINLGRRFFCNLSCAAITRDKEYPKDKRANECKHLLKYLNVNIDKYTR